MTATTDTRDQTTTPNTRPDDTTPPAPTVPFPRSDSPQAARRRTLARNNW